MVKHGKIETSVQILFIGMTLYLLAVEDSRKNDKFLKVEQHSLALQPCIEMRGSVGPHLIRDNPACSS